MFNPGYYRDEELKQAGFKALGHNVMIGRNCTIVGAERISIGSNVRIDGFTTISASGTGFVNIGSYVHIAGYSFLSAGKGIVMEDFSGISQGVKIYSRTDDYSGGHLTNPTVPAEFLGLTEGKVTLGRHAIVGSGSVILPDITLGEGVAVGALSLVTKSLEPWGVYIGAPAKRIKTRSQDLLELEARLHAKNQEAGS